MSRNIFVLILFYITTAAATVNERQDFCSNWEDIARAAMTSRQAGIPLSTMLQLVSDETAIGIFNAAYEYPKQDNAAKRQTSVNRFATLILSECLKS